MNMKIYTYSVLYSTFPEFADKLPYAVAILEDDDGKRQAAYISGYQEDMVLQIGQEVELCGEAGTGNLSCTLKG